jgi:hypothetical protein
MTLYTIECAAGRFEIHAGEEGIIVVGENPADNTITFPWTVVPLITAALTHAKEMSDSGEFTP